MLGSLWLMTIPALVFGIVGVLVPLELDRAGWTAAAIAVAWISSAAIEMFLAPMVGRVSDRHGRLLPLRVALAGAVVVLIAFSLADRPAAIVPILILSGVTFGAFWAPAMALLADAAERIGLAQGLAFGLMNVAWGTGNVLGPVIGGALADAGRVMPCPTRSPAVSAGHAPLPARRWHSATSECQKRLDPPPDLRYDGLWHSAPVSAKIWKSSGASKEGTLNGPCSHWVTG